MKTLSIFFNRQWWWSTLLALAAVAVMARLGIWQLDRLAQRRAFNTRVQAQIDQPALKWAEAAPNEVAQLPDMEYREIIVRGHYDFAQQVALRNQVWGNRAGLHLLTPLILAQGNGQQAILVDRGWIPATTTADSTAKQWHSYDVTGDIEVRGIIRRSQPKPDFGGIPDPAGVLQQWNTVNVERIDQQVDPALLPIYVQALPDNANLTPAQLAAEQMEMPKVLPARSRLDLDLSDGTHMGYALQWFAFATVLALGYPRYVWHSTRKSKSLNPVATATPVVATP